MNVIDAAKLWATQKSDARVAVVAHIESLPTREALAFMANMSCQLCDGWKDELLSGMTEGEELVVMLSTYWVSR
jgi:hypothetical protein